MAWIPPSQRPPVFRVGERLWECSPEGVHPLTVTRDERFGYVQAKRDNTGEVESLPLQHVTRQRP